MTDHSSSEYPSLKRRADNRLMFKQLNQGVRQVTNTILLSYDEPNIPINFYCECSDPTCSPKIALSAPEYSEIRRHPTWHIMLPGHDDSRLERVVERRSSYLIGEKYPQFRSHDMSS